MLPRYTRFLILLAVIACPSWAAADTKHDTAADTQALLHALDYLAVDYPHVIKNGEIIDAGEYAEQQEFAQQVVSLIDKLPAQAQKAALAQSAQALQSAIHQRAPGETVQTRCRSLAAAVIGAYQVNVAPRSIPSTTAASTLYQEHCAACHGEGGHGDGPRAAGLAPPPINFHDRARQGQRSIYSLYSTITLGINDTAMQGYPQLSEMDRWALAFYVSDFFATDVERRRGEQLWQQGRYHDLFTHLGQLTQAMPAAVAAQHGDDGVAVLAYLRAQPQQVVSGPPAPLEIARQKLGESLAAYQAGDGARAYDLAVAAYLEGFELAEVGLSTADAEQKRAVETAMMQYRQAIKQGAPHAEIEARAATLQTMLNEAAVTLSKSTGASPTVNFVSALVILLREGLEAFLVLAAIVAFLIKTDRRDALIYVHLGWLAAIAAGVATWFATKSLISFTSADREVVEGSVALIAAVMLLYVGYWLHDHSHAQRWKQFVHTRINDTLGKGTLWGLSLVSFIAVYREVAETVLFYEALWLQAGDTGHNALVAGIVTAAILLLVLAWLMFRLSVRLPLQLFFRVNAAILVVLAVVFAGKGVAALQEAGKLPANPINFPEVDLLGIHPSAEGVGLQLVMVALAIAWLAYNRLRQHGGR